MTIPNIAEFQKAMLQKFIDNQDKTMRNITIEYLMELYDIQARKYFETGEPKHLVNMANYCALIWNKIKGGTK